MIIGAGRLRTCRGCGCTDDNACIVDGVACSWVLLDFAIEVTAMPLRVRQLPSGVCSACAAEVGWDMRALATMGFVGDDEGAA